MSQNGIHLTKEYYREFTPTDLQWNIEEVDGDFTLYDLFFLVYFMNKVTPGIPATMGMKEFDAFWDQIQLDRDPDDDDDLEYLQLHWTHDFGTRVVKRTGKPKSKHPLVDNNNDYWDDPKIAVMPNLMSFHGVGKYCHVKHCNLDNPDSSHVCDSDERCLKECGYAIDFTPLNNLAHLPIHLSPKVEFFPPHVESNRNFHHTGFELTIEPTLYSFVTSIFWELTFAGFNPNEVSDHVAEIMDRVKEAKEHFEKNSDDEKEECRE